LPGSFVPAPPLVPARNIGGSDCAECSSNLDSGLPSSLNAAA